MDRVNRKFNVRWSQDGHERSKVIDNLSDLSEFVRNCDAYRRKIISITPCDPIR